MFDTAPHTWKRITLGEIVARAGGSIQTGPFGSQLHASDYVPVGIPCIMPVNIGDNRLVRDGIACIRPSDAERLARHIVRKGDIIYSRRGDVERRALVREAEDGWFCGTGCLKLRLGEGVIEPEFASYYLGHPEVRGWIVRHAVGATMPNLNTSIMESVPFLLPPPDDQRAIAAVLGSLDDKIEVNRRTARVLEGIARTIFRSWFVDFDPVRRAAAGDPTGLPPDLAALFPTRLVGSPLGEIPEGWEVGTLGEVIEAVGGGTPSTGEPAYWEGGTHAFCTPKDMSALTAPVLLGTERRVTDAGLAKINSGLLPPGTVVMSSRAPIGYLAITEIPVAVNQGIIAMRCTRGWPASFVLRWCEAHMDQIEANANGSTFQEISKTNFRPIAAVLPDPAVVAAFDRVAAPIHRRVVACERQSATLAALRDTLLPKLISGELPVPAAEAVVAEVE